MNQRVYIETTIVSYLTSKPSRDRIVAGHQAATELWWRQHRPKCDVFISEVVALEAQEGDPEASRRRAAAIVGIPLLAVTDEVSSLAKRLVRANALPSTAEDDALHVALASVFEMDVLLTWNCRHIANVIAMPKILATIDEAGYEAPTITTPSDLLESLGEMP
jgi:hypothetical protein